MATAPEHLDPSIPAYLLDHDDPAAVFRRLQRVVSHLEAIQGAATAGFDVSFRDYVLLATLRREPAPHELPVTQIARYVLRPMGSISQALGRVEAAGLVVRSPAPGDRRKVLVRLTPAGIRLADGVRAAYDRGRQAVFDRLDDDQIDRIDAAVTDLLGALESDRAAPTDPTEEHAR